MEEWKNLKSLGFSRYWVSNEGKIKGPKGIKTTWVDRDGYHIIKMYDDTHDKQNSYRLHRIVALAFISNPKGLPQVNHKDGNKDNNREDNLEWCTNQDNIIHSFDIGNHKSGESHYRAAIADIDVDEIRATYIKGHKLYGQSALARKYGVSQVCIFNILNHNSRKR